MCEALFALGLSPTQGSIALPNPVSYTHLDVYKRQACACFLTNAIAWREHARTSRAASLLGSRRKEIVANQIELFTDLLNLGKIGL